MDTFKSNQGNPFFSEFAKQFWKSGMGFEYYQMFFWHQSKSRGLFFHFFFIDMTNDILKNS